MPVEVVRYRPGEAIRWLRTGGERLRREARTKGREAVHEQTVQSRPFTDNLKRFGGAMFDMGRGAYAEMVHHLAEGHEYVLQDGHLDIVKGNSIKTIPYDRICGVSLRGDRAVVKLDNSSVLIRPVAHVSSGSAKVPVGWSRNGIEVPFELLVEEIAARAGMKLSEG